ncbi:hypothetical protein [Halobacillus andaensis]|uniref:hypothetical protein n=1 Tax=Halobacillus andaensis TaxID=1176239 RepID=UPI003D72FE14
MIGFFVLIGVWVAGGVIVTVGTLFMISQCMSSSDKEVKNRLNHLEHTVKLLSDSNRC